MFRHEVPPRPDWEARLEAHGLLFHTLDGVPYWDESACYRFTADEAEQIQVATAELGRLCRDLVAEVVDGGLFEPFHIPEPFHALVRDSWRRGDPTLYGRFDLAFDGGGPPKLLEFNADTPTALLEAAVGQRVWLADTFPGADQCNELHFALLDRWAELRADPAFGGDGLHLAAMAGQVEDYVTVEYLRDTALQAGFAADYLDVEAIGWNAGLGRHVDAQDRPIDRLFKLYPWEWMVREDFAPTLLESPTRFLEPPWRMLLSNKAILPLLWERHPDCPYLLEASFEPLAGDQVAKPVFAREGSNVRVRQGGAERIVTDGPYGEAPLVHQRLAPIPCLGGRYPVVGSWVVGDRPAGIGIREDGSLVTRNTSRFLPHLVADGPMEDVS